MEQYNKFSWKRVGTLIRLNRRAVDRQLTITVLLALVSYFIMFGATYTSPSSGLGLYTLASFILCVVFVAGPLTLSAWRDKVFECQVPATAGEKTVFAILFTVVAIPLAGLIVYWGAGSICSLFTDHALVDRYYLKLLTDHSPYMDEIPYWVYIIQQLQMLVPMCACLLTVVTSRRNVVVNGILAVVIAWIAMSIIGGLYGIYLGFSTGFQAAASGVQADPEAIVRTIMESVPTIAIICASIGILSLGVSSWLLYRKYAFRQI